ITVSPSDTSSGIRFSPSSSQRPGPTATTVPSCGFSLAVSGMTRPDAVVVSASLAWTRILSSSGLIFTFATVGALPYLGAARVSPGPECPGPGQSPDLSALQVPACAAAFAPSSRVPTQEAARLPPSTLYMRVLALKHGLEHLRRHHWQPGIGGGGQRGRAGSGRDQMRRERRDHRPVVGPPPRPGHPPPQP